MKTLTLVRKVIAQAEDELGCLARSIAILQNKSLRNFALVDESRANLKISFSRHDFDIILLGDSPFKMLLTFPRLECAIFGISSSIVPCQRNLFALDE